MDCDGRQEAEEETNVDPLQKEPAQHSQSFKYHATPLRTGKQPGTNTGEKRLKDREEEKMMKSFLMLLLCLWLRS